jgi:hypothetical protein
VSAAGVSALGAAVSLAVSGACLGIFFSTGNEAWGRANDATTALAALLLVAPVAAVPSHVDGGASLLLGVTTWIGVAGLLVIAVTSTMTAAGRLDWARSAKIGGIGFAEFLLWLLVSGAEILTRGGLPDALAWLGFVAGAATAVAAVIAFSFSSRHGHGQLFGEVQPPAALNVSAGVAFVAIVAWALVLGFALS